LVIDISDDEEPDAPIVMFNPKIIRIGDTLRMHEEGCLSMPDVRIEIERPALAEVEFLDREGKVQRLVAEGILSTCVQHELDHLDGRLIIDFASKLKRDMIIKRFKKMARGTV
jgi:peptide deformylase